MGQLRCACLVEVREGKLLLVRVRNNALWYFPGGKIEEGEDPRNTLIRECDEELGIQLIPESVRYLTTFVGPAYLREGTVELICFSAKWEGALNPSSEVSELAFIDYKKNRSLMAPAICQFCDAWFEAEFIN